MLLALGHDSGSKAGSKVFGKLVKLGIAINLDGLLGGVADYIAIVTPGKMVLQLDFGLFVEYAIQVVRQLLQKLRAFHRLPSPLSRF